MGWFFKTKNFDTFLRLRRRLQQNVAGTQLGARVHLIKSL